MKSINFAWKWKFKTRATQLRKLFSVLIIWRQVNLDLKFSQTLCNSYWRHTVVAVTLRWFSFTFDLFVLCIFLHRYERLLFGYLIKKRIKIETFLDKMIDKNDTGVLVTSMKKTWSDVWRYAIGIRHSPFSILSLYVSLHYPWRQIEWQCNYNATVKNYVVTLLFYYHFVVM